MGRRRKQKPPVDITLDRLEAKGLSGVDDQDRRWTVRRGAIGQELSVRPGRKHAAEIVEHRAPAPDEQTPACPVYGLCGGCQLQPMPLEHQRAAKAQLVARLVGFPCHGCEGATGPHAGGAYGYRNKLELSWGARRFLPTPPEDRSELYGSWLGFHPPGWFSRIVDVDGCPLGSPAMNTVIGAVKALELGPPWDNATHEGWWRHLVLREGDAGVLVTLITHPSCPQAEVEEVGEVLAALPQVSGVLWRTNDGVAEVAVGELQAVLYGDDALAITVGGVTMRLPPDAFFQVNSAGAGVLFDRIGAALASADGSTGGTLLDLYCGVGAIGLHLAERFDNVVGIELLDSAVEIARANAAANGLSGEWHAGPVEKVLSTLTLPSPRRIVVDPPRVGLHPDAAAFLAELEGDVLVYVACNPASLGRDRVLLEAGGWRLTDLWTVDLFPQTRHVEAVGRFVRG